MENRNLLCNFTNTNKFNTMKEKLELTLKVEQKEGDNTSVSVQVEASCSLIFMATSFKALMKEDENIRKAMHVSVLDDLLQMFEKEKGSEGIADRLEDILKQSKIHAQA